MSEEKEIKISGEPTLDPFVCKFIVDYPILTEGSLNCNNREKAEGSRLLEAIFDISGIREILVAGNTLTIAKDSPEPWPELGKKIGAAIRSTINSGSQLIDPDIKKKLPSEEQIRQTIENLFENEVNPAIASHGGRVELAEVEGTSVYLRLGGGCQGCASASVTLRQGIETAIRSAVPEVTEIHDVTDHASGSNPYYS
jgi:Fe-S cluster biogenesis protein NfuA